MNENGTTDFRRYDQVWQRVLPTLNPYPPGEAEETKQTALAKRAPSPGGAVPAWARHTLREMAAETAAQARLLEDLSKEEYRHAQELMRLLDRSAGT